MKDMVYRPKFRHESPKVDYLTLGITLEAGYVITPCDSEVVCSKAQTSIPSSFISHDGLLAYGVIYAFVDIVYTSLF